MPPNAHKAKFLQCSRASDKFKTLRRPEKDCCGLTIWLWGHLIGTAVMQLQRGIGTHEGEAVWQGEDEWEEGEGLKRTNARMQSMFKQPSSYG
jgi:hypothetical protein